MKNPESIKQLFKEITGIVLELDEFIRDRSIPELEPGIYTMNLAPGYRRAAKQYMLNRFMELYLDRYSKYEDITRVLITLDPAPPMSRVHVGKMGTEVLLPHPAIMGASKNEDFQPGFDVILPWTGNHITTSMVSSWLDIINQGYPEGSRFKIAPMQDESTYLGLDLVKDVMKVMRAVAGKKFNFLFMIDADILEEGERVLSFIKTFKYGDIIVHGNDKINEIMKKVKDAGFDTQGVGSIPLGKGARISIMALPRNPYKRWSRDIGCWNEISQVPAARIAKTFWMSIQERDPGTVSLLEMIEKSGRTSKSGKEGGHDTVDESDEIEILLESRGGIYNKPLVPPSGDSEWKRLLSQKKFDKLKVNGERVLKKKVAKTDLLLRSACIQGNVRKKLDIPLRVQMPVKLVDKRTKAITDASFASDGRLEGTASWLRDHASTIQDGNFIFLGKAIANKTIFVIIDFYQQLYPIIPYLKKFSRFLREFTKP